MNTALVRKLADSIIAEVIAMPDLAEAPIKSFSHLHDFCDANCLGDSEAGCERASNMEAFTECLDAAQNIVDTWLRARYAATWGAE